MPVRVGEQLRDFAADYPSDDDRRGDDRHRQLPPLRQARDGRCARIALVDRNGVSRGDDEERPEVVGDRLGDCLE